MIQRERVSDRSYMLARILWLMLAALTLVLIVASIAPRVQNLQTASPEANTLLGQPTPAEARAWEQLGLSTRFYAMLITALEVGASLVYCLVASVIFWRRSHDRAALVAAYTILPFGAIATPLLDSLLILQPQWLVPGTLLRAVGLGFGLFFFFVFPDGRFVPSWMRRLVIVWIAYNVIWPFIPGMRPYLSLYVDSTAQRLSLIWILAWLGAGVIAQIYRYRYISNAVQRQQTKWVVFGFTLTGCATIAGGAPLFVLPALHEPGAATVLYKLIVLTLILLGQLFVALAAGMSILRYRLYDIDIIIRRTLVYSILTALLALIYFGSIVLIQQVFRVEGQAQWVTVISTLAIAALFSPLRRRVQNVIDRRFYRRKYDAARTLAAFGQTARDETDLERLTARLVEVVQDTMQPASVSLWLKDFSATQRSRDEKEV